jgi:hypothetical protein
MAMINFRDFDASKVIFDEPETREIPGGKGKYSIMKVFYNYGTEDAVKKGALNIEYPEGVSNTGIREMQQDRGVNYSLQYKPLDEEEGELWKEKMDALEEAVIDFTYKKRKDVEGLKPKTTRDIVADKMKVIAYVPLDDETGERKEGSKPSHFLNLHTGGNFPGLRSKFSLVTGFKTVGEKTVAIKETLPWEAMMDKKLTLTPVVTFYRAYCNGSKLTLQNNIKSATLSCVPEAMQERDIQENLTKKHVEILVKNPDALEDLQEQIRLLKEQLAAKENLMEGGELEGNSPPEYHGESGSNESEEEEEGEETPEIVDANDLVSKVTSKSSKTKPNLEIPTL